MPGGDFQLFQVNFNDPTAMDKMQKVEEVKSEMNRLLFNSSCPDDADYLHFAFPKYLWLIATI